jgi:sucrose phosphorylase
LGSRNWIEGVEKTGRARTVNREKLDAENLLSELKDPASFRSRVFYPYLNLIKIRKRQKAFHPNAASEILDVDRRIFAIKRYAQDQTIYALTNISAAEVSLSLTDEDLPGRMTDLITGDAVNTSALTLKPYQYVWLAANDS